MGNILTLGGAGKPTLQGTDCQCIKTKRTQKDGLGASLCRVPKSKQHRSGLVFTGTCADPQPYKRK
jgi:hypothetical protein